MPGRSPPNRPRQKPNRNKERYRAIVGYAATPPSIEILQAEADSKDAEAQSSCVESSTKEAQDVEIVTRAT